MHFLPFNPVEKRTAITYIDSNGNWHRSSKGAPEQVNECNNSISIFFKFLVSLLTSSLVNQIIDLCNLKGEIRKKAHDIIANYADRGLRSLAVSRQVSNHKCAILMVKFCYGIRKY